MKINGKNGEYSLYGSGVFTTYNSKIEAVKVIYDIRGITGLRKAKNITDLIVGGETTLVIENKTKNFCQKAKKLMKEKGLKAFYIKEKTIF